MRSAPDPPLHSLVLGRAIAHEIGHFLIGGGMHSTRGLMRATIEAREFAAFNGHPFALDGETRRWLRDRLRVAVADR